MSVNIPGSYLTERVDRRIVLPAKVATFTERKKTGDILRGLEEGKAGVAVEPNKNNQESLKNRDQYPNINEKGESHEGSFCSSG
jgi:hypothetical protein